MLASAGILSADTLIMIGWAGGFVGAAAVWLFARRLRRKDPKRMFTSAERAEIKRRAGYRCEHAFLWRCSRPSEHGDHVQAHTLGYPTTLDNAQGLCAVCNNRKSGFKVSRTYIWRLERRRRSYFPAGVSPKINRKPYRLRQKDLAR